MIWNARLTVVAAVPIATGGGMMGWVPPAMGPANTVQFAVHHGASKRHWAVSVRPPSGRTKEELRSTAATPGIWRVLTKTIAD